MMAGVMFAGKARIELKAKYGEQQPWNEGGGREGAAAARAGSNLRSGAQETSPRGPVLLEEEWRCADD